MGNERERKVVSLQLEFDAWQVEHRELDERVREMVQRLYTAAEGQTADAQGTIALLRDLRVRLQQHFLREEDLGRLLIEARGTATEEIAAVCRLADREHASLLQRLDGVLVELEETSAPRRWITAYESFNLFVDALEQHEEVESDRVRWLSTEP